MNIKDYLHLYLGCFCLFPINYGTKYENLSVHRLDGVVRSRVYVSSIENGGGSCEIDKIKLILRPLSDMTEEEDQIEFPKNNRGEFIDMHWYPEGYIWLLSKGFDLFGLHEAGLCLYKNANGELY